MATLSVPVVVQAVIGALLLAMWLLGKGPYRDAVPHAGERAWMATALAVTIVPSLLASAVLLRSRGPRLKGLGLSLAGCSVAVLVGGAIFDYLILR